MSYRIYEDFVFAIDPNLAHLGNRNIDDFGYHSITSHFFSQMKLYSIKKIPFKPCSASTGKMIQSLFYCFKDCAILYYFRHFKIIQCSL